MTSGDLPEGVIDAEPPGSWESVADGETAERGADAEGSTELSTAGHDEAAEGVDVGETPDGPVAPDANVESARLEAEMDPDLSTENPDDFEKEQDS